ncbi:MAG: DNA polymerase III subunit gamma/tau [Alphaproteobacteria bacterium]|nr:MAG: DNA polymerase III subunit gamma/tau [Alphaproteobacteria bacterium]TAF13195.1 MAG: DNA polymerase III subunit gamma/tau [Alphaproteobacteria bacterium]TAF40227.1 MAG: DNA polymerase III subunit gamma/tau [Alphaproteobacteria bacterium]TAF77357.1 MAG: DNA polymerase III subunit gamma/tau [Alphaproteobacteria bacterium]
MSLDKRIIASYNKAMKNLLSSPYRVLARSYRPQTFEDLVGQEVLVRTLGNAFSTGRIAHAYLLTGIRGIGKTTTARIIAKALNCTGAHDEFTSPTATPCGVCSHCMQIQEDHHIDVLEMDAASHTGVDDARKLIDAVQYRPVAGRYKVFIIDEAHMLSNSAFNALLKTLEEPPPHVVFIFATTEIRKIPVTILSRCQRFDLRRLMAEEMATHLANIAQKEHIRADKGALDIIAHVSEGSVRDALSLLDQAISHSSGTDTEIHITAQTMRDVLSIADRTLMYHMLQDLFTSKIGDALDRVRAFYAEGVHMPMLAQDMLHAIHLITRLIVTPNITLDHTLSEGEKELLHSIAQIIPLSSATRAWQMMLKGLEEIKKAPDPLAAMEMVLIRFSYAAQMPDPDKLIQALRSQLKEGTAPHTPSSTPNHGTKLSLTVHHTPSAVAHALATQPRDEPNAPPSEEAITLATLIAWLEDAREAILVHHLKTEVRVVSCARGSLVISESSPITSDKMQAIAQALSRCSDMPWMLTKSKAEGLPTWQEQQQRTRNHMIEAAKNDPLVAQILATFVDSAIVDIT